MVMRSFYLNFPNMNALRSELTWTHYRLLLRVENSDARNFYLLESIENNWSARELDRQISSLLYERIALSRDKEEVKELSTRGQVIQKPDDVIKDPYVLEFLGLEEGKRYLEKDLEQALINRLQNFLLELGKGFSFVARQKRITIDGDHFYIDLVFYNYIAYERLERWLEYESENYEKRGAYYSVYLAHAASYQRFCWRLE